MPTQYCTKSAILLAGQEAEVHRMGVASSHGAQGQCGHIHPAL